MDTLDEDTTNQQDCHSALLRGVRGAAGNGCEASPSERSRLPFENGASSSRRDAAPRRSASEGLSKRAPLPPSVAGGARGGVVCRRVAPSAARPQSPSRTAAGMRSASATGGTSNASAGLVTRSYEVWFDLEAATTSATTAVVVDGATPVHLLCTSLAATVGLVLNAYILVVLFWQRQFRTANSLLLLHLAFVDSVFCLLVLASNAVFGGLSASADVIDASGACYVQGVLWAVVPAVAVWTLCGLSCDRYAAIASPLHYSRLVNTRRTCVFLGVSWIVAAGSAVPPLVGVCPYSYGPSRCVCVAACAGTGADLQAGTAGSSPVGLGYALSYVWLALVLPASLIVASNLQGAADRANAQAPHRGRHLRGIGCRDWETAMTLASGISL
ncbi:hypothetical protein HPB50_006398 [Hyalomma asiaticum]|uniref:Uncharacterized protein n=1 Tax=Hyalomma asiaticum TaxID=266040 RepID=A0ACB7SD00_HYAAI|nr:hypothetical protein HPB50_006398 [Hyalomma asiaticum]